MIRTNKPVIRAATAAELARAGWNGPLYACQRGDEHVFGEPAHAFGSTPAAAFAAFNESEALDRYYGALAKKVKA